jgi:peroxiredoxin
MSKKIQIDTQAPSFQLDDFDGKAVTLSEYRGRKHVVLVFNRGFT